MVDIREFTQDDVLALQKAIDADTFHPGEWRIEHFYNPKTDPETYTPAFVTTVIEDQHGPIAFVRFTKTLRISCMWNDAQDVQRNARAIIHGIRDAVQQARASGFQRNNHHF